MMKGGIKVMKKGNFKRDNRRTHEKWGKGQKRRQWKIKKEGTNNQMYTISR